MTTPRIGADTLRIASVVLSLDRDAAAVLRRRAAHRDSSRRERRHRPPARSAGVEQDDVVAAIEFLQPTAICLTPPAPLGFGVSAPLPRKSSMPSPHGCIASSRSTWPVRVVVRPTCCPSRGRAPARRMAPIGPPPPAPRGCPPAPSRSPGCTPWCFALVGKCAGDDDRLVGVIEVGVLQIPSVADGMLQPSAPAAGRERSRPRPRSLDHAASRPVRLPVPDRTTRWAT